LEVLYNRFDHPINMCAGSSRTNQRASGRAFSTRTGGDSSHLTEQNGTVTDGSMQQIITAKLKLLTTPEQRQVLRQTQLAYRDALNYVSCYAFAHGKLSNRDRLQKGTYREIRALFNLPSQMACNVPRQVAATYKGLWTKLRQNLTHRKAGYTKKRYKGLDKPPKYVSPTLTYNHGYDYGFKVGQQVSVLTVQGRIVLPYLCYDRHSALIRKCAAIGAAKLWYDKTHKQYYLLVALELDLPEPTPATLRDVVGVDVGMRYLATTATMNNDSHFYPGKRVRARETVETASRSHHREIHCECAPTHFDRPGRTHRHS
jgi:putative transposase